jgi:hypothetical protein
LWGKIYSAAESAFVTSTLANGEVVVTTTSTETPTHIVFITTGSGAGGTTGAISTSASSTSKSMAQSQSQSQSATSAAPLSKVSKADARRRGSVLGGLSGGLVIMLVGIVSR